MQASLILLGSAVLESSAGKNEHPKERTLSFFLISIVNAGLDFIYNWRVSLRFKIFSKIGNYLIWFILFSGFDAFFGTGFTVKWVIDIEFNSDSKKFSKFYKVYEFISKIIKMKFTFLEQKI